MAPRPARRATASRRVPSSVTPALAVLLVVGFCLAAAGCGGGGTTTVIEKVEAGATSSPPSQAAEKPALLKLPTYEHETVEPSIYSFVVDGSFAGAHLKWEDWGSQTATGTGIIEERDFNGGFNDRKRYPGTVIATGLEECKGRNYYTEVSANVPPNAIYVPEETTQLTTPCRSYESLKAEAEPEVEEGEPEEAEVVKSQFFFTPSHNIGCALSPEGIRCDIRHKTWAPPPKPSDCMSDWGHSVGLETGEGEVLCAGDTLLTGDYRVLAYGRALQRGIFTCTSQEDGLTCTNNSSHGFFLSVDELKLF